MRAEIKVLFLYFKDILSSKLNGKFNKHLQPSSTVPEWRAKDNDLRLLLTNGRIIKYVTGSKCPRLASGDALVQEPPVRAAAQPPGGRARSSHSVE